MGGIPRPARIGRMGARPAHDFVGGRSGRRRCTPAHPTRHQPVVGAVGPDLRRRVHSRVHARAAGVRPHRLRGAGLGRAPAVGRSAPLLSLGRDARDDARRGRGDDPVVVLHGTSEVVGAPGRPARHPVRVLRALGERAPAPPGLLPRQFLESARSPRPGPARRPLDQRRREHVAPLEHRRVCHRGRRDRAAAPRRAQLDRRRVRGLRLAVRAGRVAHQLRLPPRPGAALRVRRDRGRQRGRTSAAPEHADFDRGRVGPGNLSRCRAAARGTGRCGSRGSSRRARACPRRSPCRRRRRLRARGR